MDLRLLGIGAALGSAAAWAVGSILFKKLGEHLPPIAMTLAKGSLSVMLLLLALVFTGWTPISWRAGGFLIASGLCGIALGDTFFFGALRRLSPQTLVILLMSGQVLTALLAVLFLGERLQPIDWLGIALVIVGVGTVVWEKSQEKSSWQGIMLGFLAVACMSVSILLAKPALDEAPALGSSSIGATIQATAIRMAAGTLGIGLFGWYRGSLTRWTEPFTDRQLLGRFVVAVAVVTFGGFWLSLVAVKYVEVAIASTLSAAEPVFILPLTVVWLREPVTRQAIVGTIVALGGVVILSQ
jgi:drug/metabolite transporter (DMT)-like permease